MQTIIDSQNDKKKPLKLYAAVFASLLITLPLLASALFSSEKSDDAQIYLDEITIKKVKTGNLIRDVRAPGNLIAKHRQWLSARVNAKVIKRMLEPGAVVNPDTVILKLSSPELIQAYKKVKIEHKVVQAQLDALKEVHITQMYQKQADVKLLTVEKQQAIEDAAAKKQLIDDKIIPQYQYSEAVLREKQLTLQLEIAQFELKQLPRLQASLLKVEQAKVAQQALQVSLLQEQVALLNVTAQIHGILQSIAVEEGQEVSLGTELARVADQTNLKAELRVQESQAKDVQLGQIVEIDTRRSKITGTVTRIDPAVINGTVTVDIALPNKLPSEARPDLRVNGIIEIKRLDNVLLLDKPAHWQTSDTAYFFKLLDNSTAIKTQVSIGANSARSIQVLTGLKQGEQVIMSNTAHLEQYKTLQIN
ncbi:efflux RND transporter periplasmic adaptor subunit [Pseudoalteromonas denitrificans]|uniref:HlyD family secretion protein n=1 Tax=Pseudoalteromonas denitrificans DSM 6059 TaxID=1123010 RepID=A0A1I1TF94_9GAMM|nr:HlyD family efflux transporter periplasmic adaptor subunit [Pseudoalteromonas denitrificans]SFD57265.1 HlyD family secretion protein [Pseudoalteromonas denitrificans DSM 6059]